MLGHGAGRSTRRFYGADHSGPLMNGHRSLADTHHDPMEGMGNLFDVAILLGVGFMVVALSGFGLQEILSDEQVTIVKNPGTEQMEIITKQGSTIERLKSTDERAEGPGAAVGTVYRLRDGRMVWVPGTELETGAGVGEESAPIEQQPIVPDVSEPDLQEPGVEEMPLDGFDDLNDPPVVTP